MIPFRVDLKDKTAVVTGAGGVICSEMARALAECGANGIYPIADDEMLSTNRLIELIAETCGKKAKLWRIPKGLMRVAAKFGDILHLPLNTERIEKLTENSFVENAALKAALGWQKMPIAAEEGMRLTLKSFQSPFPPSAFPNSPPNLSQI